MFLELIATVFAGMAMAGVLLVLNKILGRRLPGWIIPVGAGLAMIAMTISNEYTWYTRTTAGLPDGLMVADAVEKRSFYQPWTYARPYVNRFVAVDGLSLRRNPDVPDQRMADLYFFGRWSPVQKVPALMDCAGGRRASLIDGVEYDDAGQVVNAAWIAVAEGDPVQKAVCEVP